MRRHEPPHFDVVDLVPWTNDIGRVNVFTWAVVTGFSQEIFPCDAAKQHKSLRFDFVAGKEEMIHRLSGMGGSDLRCVVREHGDIALDSLHADRRLTDYEIGLAGGVLENPLVFDAVMPLKPPIKADFADLSDPSEIRVNLAEDVAVQLITFGAHALRFGDDLLRNGAPDPIVLARHRLAPLQRNAAYS